MRLIDADHLLFELLRAKNRELNIGKRHGINKASHIVEHQPTADKWIPCSERLPDNLQEVVVTFLNHEPESYYAELKDKPQIGVAVFCCWEWYWYTPTTKDMLAEYQRFPNALFDEALEVIAWQPLQEPYKEKECEIDEERKRNLQEVQCKR